MSSWQLELVGGPALPEKLLTIGDALLIGRSAECQLLLPDASVSRLHARIDRHGQSFSVTDLGSRGGSYINDEQLPANQATSLREHDRLRIGPFRFRLRRIETAPISLGGPVRAAGATIVAQPLLAAERRLELLVEFAASSSQAADRQVLAALLVDFARRGCTAVGASLRALPDGAIWAASPVEGVPLPGLEALDAARQGGVVPGVLEVEGLKLPTLSVLLKVDKAPAGLLQLVFERPDPRQRAEAPELLHALSRLAGLSLGNLERIAAESRMRQMQADLEQAREVQRRIAPAPRGQVGPLQYGFHLHPGAVVAGDLVDLFAVADGRIAVVLGDVAGHGVGAGYLMGSTQAYLHAALGETRDLAQAVTRCNRYVARVGGGRFVTAWIALFDPKDGSWQVIDAGHSHAALWHRACVGKLPLTGTFPLGVDPWATFTAERWQLPPGGRLLLYSDGVVEHRAPDQREFGLAGISDALLVSRSPQEDVELVQNALDRHGRGIAPNDDATFLSIAVG